jgi:hypothetical protein
MILLEIFLHFEILTLFYLAFDLIKILC